MIELAKGIRFPTKEEVCCVPNMEKKYDNEKKIFESDSKKIVNGYTVSESDDERFKFSFEINIDVSRLRNLFWDIGTALFSELDEIYCIYGLKDSEEMELTDYKNKGLIRKTLEQYKYSFVNDGFLAVGIAFDKEIIEEVFIETYKYIRMYTSQMDKMLEVFNKYDLKEVQDMRFIDEFLVVSESMFDEENGIPHADDIVEELNKIFNS